MTHGDVMVDMRWLMEGPDNSLDMHLDLTVRIVIAYLSNNYLPLAQVPTLIETVSAILYSLMKPQTKAEPDIRKATPAQIRNSIRPDGLISFLDGKPYQQLGRHLRANGLTFDAYRLRYGLPTDYPSASPNHSAMRAEQAAGRGLGRSIGKGASRARKEQVERIPAPADPVARSRRAAR